jgi:DNA-binding beta-propeller fold protein YncE
MPLVVTSAAGVNGDGYGALLAFGIDGSPRGVFSHDARVADPRGLAFDQSEGLLFVNSGADRVLALDAKGHVVRDTGPIAGLNPGGGNFAPDGRLVVGMRTARSIMAFAPSLDQAGQRILPQGVVPFPRGFAFDTHGRLFLASGTGPDGEGDDTIRAFNPAMEPIAAWEVDDPELSPLDLTIAPNGNIVVSSERPFGAPDAVTTVREYDASDGHLVRVLSAAGGVEFRKPRGLRFDHREHLYCVAQDEVVAFDFTTGACLGAVVRLKWLNGQALMFIPGDEPIGVNNKGMRES